LVRGGGSEDIIGKKGGGKSSFTCGQGVSPFPCAGKVARGERKKFLQMRGEGRKGEDFTGGKGGRIKLLSAREGKKKNFLLRRRRGEAAVRGSAKKKKKKQRHRGVM